MTKKYHYFYKITNNINGHFYYGVHNTNNLDDGYMGSGTRLHIAYKKYGIDNFTKEILKFFDSAEDAFTYEAEIVNETLVNDCSCYNMTPGGAVLQENMITVRDKNGNHLNVKKDDPRYLSGELIPMFKGYATSIDSEGNLIKMRTDDPKFISNIKGYIMCKNIKGEMFLVREDDERYISKELVPYWKGRHHTEETKKKISLTHKENHHQQGNKNSQYGTCWVMKDGISQKIKKEELERYLQLGYIKGRKIK